MFLEMVKKADVVVSNFVPGNMEKLGIGYDTLSKIKPSLVYAESSGFGAGGPYSNYPAFDAVAKAAGGAYSTTGEPDRPPVNPGPPIGDTGVGVHMAVAILAALRYRDITGEGQAIDMAMADNIINLQRSLLRFTLETGEPVKRMGGSEPGEYPWDVFECKGKGPNNYVFIGSPRDHHYQSLMKIVGRNDLSDINWRDRLSPENRVMLKKVIEKWTKTKEKYEAFHLLAQADIPSAPVLDTVEVSNDPHFVQRGIIVESVHPKRGKHKMVGCPVKMSKSPVEIKPAPLLGQHNEEVYREWLGLKPEELGKLKEEKVI